MSVQKNRLLQRVKTLKRDPRPCLFMSLSAKLEKFLADQTEKTKPSLPKITFEELAQRKIQFGEAKFGMSFEEAFTDQRWTKWFIKSYEKSQKPEHKMFIQFVTLKNRTRIKQEDREDEDREERSKLVLGPTSESRRRSAHEPLGREHSDPAREYVSGRNGE